MVSGLFSKPDIEPRLHQFCSGSLSKTDTDRSTQWLYMITRLTFTHIKQDKNPTANVWKYEYEQKRCNIWIWKHWRQLIQGLQGIKLLHTGVKCLVFWNQASESIHAELNQFSITVCVLDHTFELNNNPFPFSPTFYPVTNQWGQPSTLFASYSCLIVKQ